MGGAGRPRISCGVVGAHDAGDRTLLNGDGAEEVEGSTHTLKNPKIKKNEERENARANKTP